MKKHLYLLISLSVGLVARGDLLLEDFFDNADLPTANEPTGGYYEQGSGNGSVTELGSSATLTSSSNKNDFYGMLSSNTVSSSAIAPTTPVRTTWTITNSDLKSKTSSVVFTWQTSDTLTLEPEFGIHLKQTSGEWTLEMFTSNTNNGLDDVVLDIGFGENGDIFTLSATFTESGFEVYGSGALLKGGLSPAPPLLQGSWGVVPLSNTDEYRAGVFTKANGTAGLVIDVDSIRIESIPEPTIISLIALSGGILLLGKRLGALRG